MSHETPAISAMLMDPIPDRLAAWAWEQPLVAALLATSSRTNSQAPVDALSDYDVIVVVSDLGAFLEDEAWLPAYGTPIVRFRDRHTLFDIDGHTRLVLYEDGTKIDYTLWPVALLERVCTAPRLPDVLDVGYQVLVDKRGLTGALAPPTYRAHIPNPPTEAEYLALVEEFWWESTYVAKNLWRDELLPAKYSLQAVMIFDLLRRMLEWHVEIGREWSWKPGPVGRGLKRELPADVWAEVEAAFVGAGLDDNWAALFRTTALFRRVAGAVADGLGYVYPEEMDQQVRRYLLSVRALPRNRD